MDWFKDLFIDEAKAALDSKNNSGGDGGFVVSEDDTISEATQISNLKNLRIRCPNVDALGDGAFQYCIGLTAVDFPSVTSVGDHAFLDCTNLTSVDFPAATSIGNTAFRYCIGLTAVDFPAATSIGNYAFLDCTNLDTVILRNASSACQIIVNAFRKTKIMTADGMPTGEGFIYVTSSLYEDYIANLTERATAIVGDAAVAEQMVRAIFRKIEDYPEICGS